jgi:hypothetical protein
MLVLTRTSEDVLLWYLHCNERGDRLDGVIELRAMLVTLRARSLRIAHGISTLGRSSERSICDTDLRPPPDDAFDNMPIYRGKPIASSTVCCLGRKDTPSNVAHNNHFSRLRFISGRYLVLCGC